MKAASAVADPRSEYSTLPWFWSLDVQGDSVSNDWMNECERFHSLHFIRLRYNGFDFDECAGSGPKLSATDGPKSFS
ncbi:hypothetical protein BDR07DRAFT_1307879 [Suillus spraguei]|nr:hypothetical protein BDR07DRAFT_1319944 [Suillus spraguei]KAG2352881.1 hypothetical protein BDR07DRAFT_1312117 [Suillus spraguei]KAG2353900.1 hypothetical protein BDR07DRAFT_1307879 [Suillus spraguei]